MNTMYLKYIKKDQKTNSYYNHGTMETLDLFFEEGIILHVYEDFLRDICDPEVKELIYNSIKLEKLKNDLIKISYHLSPTPDRYSLIVGRNEVIKITNMAMDLMNKDWEEIYIEFDGTTFDIIVDNKPYL